MPQHDGVISDQNGLDFLADLNAFIAAIITNNSGATEPTTTYARQFWADTTAGILKIRNAANTDWISLLDLVTGAPLIGVAGARIKGDFSNATAANRAMFQTSTTNGNSIVGAMPNGTGNTAHYAVYNNSDVANASYGAITVNATDFRIQTAYGGTGTYLPMTFYTGGSERMRIDTSGNITVGATALLSEKLTVKGAITAQRSNAGQGLQLDCESGIGSISTINNANTDYLPITFKQRNSTPVSRDVASVDANGNFLVTLASGLGYGTGSGGTVTQTTSKATSVTLNKPCGQITMNNAALAAGATATFALLNSLIAATDSIDLTMVNSTGSRQYTFDWHLSGAGGCYISVTNETAGSLSDALVINFTVIKGATA